MAECRGSAWATVAVHASESNLFSPGVNVYSEPDNPPD